MSGAWFVKGALTEQQKSNMLKSYSEILEVIDKDREFAIASLIKYASIPDNIAQKIRLNEWYIINDETTQQNAQEFAELFARNGGISALPKEGWIWDWKN